MSKEILQQGKGLSARDGVRPHSNGADGAARRNTASNGLLQTVEDVAARLNLRHTGDKDKNGQSTFRGADPRTGEGDDRFVLFIDGNATLRDGGETFSPPQVAELAGISPDQYQPCAEFRARNGAQPVWGRTTRPTTSVKISTKSKTFDTRSLEERGQTPAARRFFQVSEALDVESAWGEYRQFPTFHPDGTEGRQRRKFRDPSRQPATDRNGKARNQAKTIWHKGERQDQPVAYGLNWIEEGETIYLVNSELAVWLFWQEGKRAICPLGEGRSEKPFGAIFQTAKDKGAAKVIALLDADATGESGTAKAMEAARAVGLPETAKQFPEGINDASDFWEQCHRQKREFTGALGELPDRLIAPTPTEHVQPPLPEDIRARFQSACAQIASPCSLADVKAAYRRFLQIEDDSSIEFILGAVAANVMDGDAVWPMLVGASSGGETELVSPLLGLPFVKEAAVLTESALLSGSSKRDRARNAKGGLLREIGPFGFLVLKDFTSILSMNKDAKTATLAALREVYDGSWTRHVGSDGGQELQWKGKLCAVACCTEAIDEHHAVIGAMGERFAFFRLPPLSRQAMARRAISQTGSEAQMRSELQRVVAGLFAGVEVPALPHEPSEEETERLVNLADFASRCRSAVMRDPHTRDISLVLESEYLARLAKILRRLFSGMLCVGVERERAWQNLTKIGFDSMHKTRRQILDLFLQNNAPMTTAKVAVTLDVPTTTARRALEELTAHKVLQRRKMTSQALKEMGSSLGVWPLFDQILHEYPDGVLAGTWRGRCEEDGICDGVEFWQLVTEAVEAGTIQPLDGEVGEEGVHYAYPRSNAQGKKRTDGRGGTQDVWALTQWSQEVLSVILDCEDGKITFPKFD